MDRGFTLIEAVMSILIVGLMLVAALNTVGASKVAQARIAEQAIGPMLAQDLMSEILCQYYREPDDSILFGLELNELGSSRAAYDDVDDYNGWSAGPPRAKDNLVLPDLTNWSRQVSVAWADTSDPNNNSLTETGMKRITVTVKYQGRTVYTLSALRTDGWPEVALEAGDDGGLLGGVLKPLF
ncbi:MAG: type II secretion system protein [Phycisphaerales bacterium]